MLRDWSEAVRAYVPVLAAELLPEITRASIRGGMKPCESWLPAAAGFIGSAYVRHVLREQPNDEVFGLDLLTYAGNLANLDEVRDDPRFRFVQGDIADAGLIGQVAQDVDAIVNFAAESHVDRSLLDPGAFARANVIGVMALLEAARTEWSATAPSQHRRGLWPRPGRPGGKGRLPIAAPITLFSGEGGRRADVPSLRHLIRDGRRHHPGRQHHRPPSVSGEAGAVVRHQRPPGSAVAGLR